MIYAVVPLANSKEISRKIKDLSGSRYEDYEPKVYLIDYNGTTRSLAEKLGIGGKDKIEALVLGVKTYDGFANLDVWEWFKNRGLD